MALGAGGCQARDIVPGVNDSTFVQTMAALRTVQGDSSIGDSARAFRRDSVLKAHRVSASQLERAASALAGDVDRAEADFQAINRANGIADSVRARRATLKRKRG